jgi:hypothetical protein
MCVDLFGKGGPTLRVVHVFYPVLLWWINWAATMLSQDVLHVLLSGLSQSMEKVHSVVFNPHNPANVGPLALFMSFRT